MATTDELLDILMKDYKKPEDLIGENGLLKQLTKRLLYQVLTILRARLHNAEQLYTLQMCKW